MYMSVDERLAKMRHMMTEVGVSAVLIPTSDCHDSEYVAAYYKFREYMSGFTGSAGTLVVFMEDAYLFTDGRYFIQAEAELSGSEIKLMKIGEKGVPKLIDFVISKMQDGQTLCFDGKLVSANQGEKFENELKKKNCRIRYDMDFIYGIWENRPKLENKEVYILDEKYTGESAKAKIDRLKAALKDRSVEGHIITTLDDIAWLLNLRGDDIEYCPVFLSYMLFLKDEVVLYADIEEERQENIKEHLESNNIILRPYSDFYEDSVKRVKKCTISRLLLDKNRANYYIYRELKGVIKDIKSEATPVESLKCIKNDVEIANIEKANIVDGIAMLRFQRWLKDMIEDGERVSEISAEEKLLEFRQTSGEMIEPSFKTISAYGEHSAIVHYEATAESDVELKKGSFLMVDSGGHYLNGTTDVTRTYAIGEVSEKLKQDYTLVLKGMLRIMDGTYMKGTTGSQIDMVARTLFWEKGLDFKHGTGHGIGYLLNVHEGPVRISWGGSSCPAFKPGMLVSDEPGLYIKGSHGIRIENDVVCIDKEETEFGSFIGFKPVTYVPIDKSAIFIEDMSGSDIVSLNRYHSLVFEKLSPFLEGDELDYLKAATAPL